MSESKGGTSGLPEEGARKPGQPGRKPGASARKAAGSARETAASTRNVAGNTGKAAASTRNATAGARKPAKGSAKAKQQAAPKIVPIYARLPRGPHPLGAPGVARNQRIRIHGGMIEAVTTRGYPQTSVKLIVGLAGVSRRSFYEQFSGKEECFMATFDLIANRAVKRLTEAYRTAEGDQRQRLRAALRAWGTELEQNPKALRLALAETPAAGAEGLRRLQKTTAVCEGLLASALSGGCPPAAGGEPSDGAAPEGRAGNGAGAADGRASAGSNGAGAGESPARAAGNGAGAGSSDALPLPVVRAIVGGLRRATQHAPARRRHRGSRDRSSEEMVKWSLLFKSPALGRLRPRRCANQPFPETLELEPDACGGESRRARAAAQRDRDGAAPTEVRRPQLAADRRRGRAADARR